jgi:murein DD-endopeptidase MepM/ murein hydrolase activator NlpD
VSAGNGTVVNVRKNQIDQEIGYYNLNEPVGNFVVIQHGPNLFSLYAHMMQSSATVSIGDAVAAGQVIGMIGNSGYSTAPHIHFQYMDNADIVSGKGLPALFWGAKVNRVSDAVLQGIVSPFPDIRVQGYLLTAGTYTMTGSTPLEYDIVTAP